jgi:hypothetical protein
MAHHGQALRVRGICSDLKTFEQREVELTRYFVSRGHDTKHTLEAVDRARNLERSEALKYKSKGALFRVPFVTTYHPKLPPIGVLVPFCANTGTSLKAIHTSTLCSQNTLSLHSDAPNLRGLLVNAS